MTTKTNNQTQKTLSKDLEAKVNKLPTKSAKIRYLASQGWTRSQIAKFLGIRYQHVRNVLITPVKNPKS